MSTAEKIKQKYPYEELFRNFTPEEGPALAWFQKIRRKAYDRFQSVGFPTRHLEDWKYISLDPVLKVPFKPLDFDGEFQKAILPESLEPSLKLNVLRSPSELDSSSNEKAKYF